MPLPKFGNNAGMAGKNTSVALGERYEAYVRSKVASGEFATISEVIRDALRQAEERDARTAWLDAEIQKGLNSGPARPFDWDAFMERHFGSNYAEN